MTEPDLNSEWEDMAPNWIREMRHGRNANRAGLLDRPMIEQSGDVAGKKVVDFGCGEGRFCRILSGLGAKYVLGLDRSKTMIDAACELQTGNDEYRVADVHDLRFLGDQTFDLAISYLNHCDLPDFAANTREAFRILKFGGKFIVSNIHPMRSAVGLWQKDESGKRDHVILDDYLDEGLRHWTILDVRLTNFHRSLETCVNTYIEAGFLLERLLEPTVSPSVLKNYPELEDELRVPSFIIFVLRKR